MFSFVSVGYTKDTFTYGENSTNVDQDKVENGTTSWTNNLKALYKPLTIILHNYI